MVSCRKSHLLNVPQPPLVLPFEPVLLLQEFSHDRVVVHVLPSFMEAFCDLLHLQICLTLYHRLQAL